MVHGPLTIRRLLGVGLGLLAAALLAGISSAPAQAANTRVSITDFAWSNQPTIDLGESVTWDWLGPDLQHSITGQEPNAEQWDSDPDTSTPRHNLGDSYTVRFDEPGQYLFVCKLHPQAVRGVVTVTDRPGDPNSDPGPQAPLNFDLEPPLVEDVQLSRTVLGPRGGGTALQFANSERGTASIDYHRLVRIRRGRKIRWVWKYAGYHERSAHIGLNGIRIAHRSKTFRARPGRYIALFRIEDESSNSSPVFRLRFQIKGNARKKRARKRRAMKRQALKRRARKRQALKRRAQKRQNRAGVRQK